MNQEKLPIGDDNQIVWNKNLELILIKRKRTKADVPFGRHVWPTYMWFRHQSSIQCVSKLPCALAMKILGIYAEQMKSVHHRDIFTVAKTGNGISICQ